MSAASRATSVPARPIAMPMSAAFSAGASLTPSPVIATTSPLLCSARTIASFCSGATRAYTLVCAAVSRSSPSSIAASCTPVRTRAPRGAIPISAAIATAATG